MSTVTPIGLDIAKSVFWVHGISATGEVLIRRRVRRGQVLKLGAFLPPCLIGIEACASAYHWSRELQRLGHEVKLMPPAYVKPYMKRQKNDMAEAEAICEAVTRPTMRFVETRTCEQQSILMLHRVRQMQVRQKTMLTNAIRAHLAEFGLVAKIGREGGDELLLMVREGDERVPEPARACILALAEQLVPKQNSSGGKERLGGVTTQGNRYLRSMLTVGARAVIRFAQRHGTKRPWIVQLLARRATKVAAVALASKMVRMVWAIMVKGERYREPVGQAA